MTKVKKAHNVLTSTQLVETIDALQSDRASWESGSYKASNIELYGIIGRGVDLIAQLKADRTLRVHFVAELNARKIDFTNGTSLSTRVARLIFGDCGNRAFTYAAVIDAAVSAGIDSLGVPAWITKQNGIENVRRAHSKGSTVSPKELAKMGADACESYDSLCVIDTDDEQFAPNGDATHVFSVALLRQSNSGECEVVFGTSNQSAVTKVLVEAGRVFKSDSEKSDLENSSQKSLKSIETAVQSTLEAKVEEVK